MSALFGSWRKDEVILQAPPVDSGASASVGGTGLSSNGGTQVQAEYLPVNAGTESDASYAARFEELFEVLPVAAIQCDQQGRITRWNAASAQLYRKKLDEVLGQTVWHVVTTAKSQEQIARQVQAALEGKKPASVEMDIGRGEMTRSILCHCYPLQDPEIGERSAVLICLDRTARTIVQAPAHMTEATYHSIVANSPQGVFRLTPDHKVIEANASFARIFGYETPKRLLDLLKKRNAFRNEFFKTPERYDELMRVLTEQGRAAEFEVEVEQDGREPIWVEINAHAVHDKDNRLSYFEGALEDITRRKAAEEKLLRDALHDKLTGLPNRALFMERLGRSLARIRRLQDYQFAVLFVDLDRFKIVNDSLGHLVGDQLLQITSRKLEACLRPGDTVARMGGDEFAILLDDIENLDAAMQVAERIQKRLSMPLRLSGQEIFTTASIGIVKGSGHYEEPEDLLRDADMAMYKAKQTGKAHYEVFTLEMTAKANTELQLETDLRRAVQRNEFQLEYQPIVSLTSGRISGFEALVRWRHPERGTISPGDFVPLAEETGLILPIGRWALREACRQIAVWNGSIHGRAQPLTMAVNLSTRQFAQPDLVRYTEGVLRQTKLDPRYLKLEITESVIMANVESATAMLLQFKELGIRLSIDDFGTGYSSLAYLQKFPISSLKIDRSFVSRMDVSDENEEIVRTIVQLAHNLKMDVIAEGVETNEQLAHLRALEAEYGQGYYFAGPMDGQTAGAFISAGPQW